MELLTLNPILNLGGIFVVLLAYPLQLILMYFFGWVLKRLRIKGCPRWFKRLVNKSYKLQQVRKGALLFTHLLIIIFESVFQMFVSILLHIQGLAITGDTELDILTRVWSEITFVSIILLLLFLIFILYRIAVVEESVLKNQKVIKKFGILWEGIRVNEVHKRRFNIMFVCKRIAMAIIIVHLQAWSANAI